MYKIQAKILIIVLHHARTFEHFLVNDWLVVPALNDWLSKESITDVAKKYICVS